MVADSQGVANMSFVLRDAIFGYFIGFWPQEKHIVLRWSPLQQHAVRYPTIEEAIIAQRTVKVSQKYVEVVKLV